MSLKQEKELKKGRMYAKNPWAVKHDIQCLNIHAIIMLFCFSIDVLVCSSLCLFHSFTIQNAFK